MAFREKAAWASLLVTLIVWSSYFLTVATEIAGGRPDGDLVMERFVGTVVLSIVLSIVSAIALALFAGGDADAPADERERLIGLRATNLAYTILSLGVLFVALTTPFIAAVGLDLFPGRPEHATALIAANGVLFAFVLAEVSREIGQIVGYRRGR